MGLFDSLFSDNPFVIHENPRHNTDKIVRQVIKEQRREIEQRAEDLHPSLGKVTKSLFNFNDTVENANDSLKYGVLRSLLAFEAKDLAKADHLFVQRAGYTHHGLFIGDGKVIHYLLEKLKIDSLETFADGSKIQKKSDDESPIYYSRDRVISRAYSRLGEYNYNLFCNNCENFVRWCRNGTE